MSNHGKGRSRKPYLGTFASDSMRDRRTKVGEHDVRFKSGHSRTKKGKWAAAARKWRSADGSPGGASTVELSD